MGQPSFATHPQRLKRNQINPGVNKAEFRFRRQRLAEALSAHAKSAVVVICAAKRQYSVENTIPLPFFRQDPDFRYLCGGLEPDSALLIDVNDGDAKSVLFTREPNPTLETWEGARTRPSENAREFFAVDECLSISDLAAFVLNQENGNKTLFYDRFNVKNAEVDQVLREAKFGAVASVTPFIQRLRSVKSDSEIALVKTTCSAAAEAMKTAMKASLSAEMEGDLATEFEYVVKRKFKAQTLSFPPVVASGSNANVIHYGSLMWRDLEGRRNRLLLMDAGCEIDGYSSDVSRTWPLNGRFSAPQRVLYELVLDCQKRLLKIAAEERPRISLDGLYSMMLRILNENLKSAGIIKSDGGRIRNATEFCPHHVSHFLGMDVHDTPLTPKTLPLVKGNVITIEPGVYIPHHFDEVAPEFRGVGVRVEDDVLVSESGVEVLTNSCPVHVEDIETLLAH